MVSGKGFDGIISALTYGSYASSQVAMCALVDWWMDTTHMVHLPFGEITVIPIDFAAITGLSFSREPVQFSSEAYSFIVMRNRWLRDSFGIMAFVKSCYSSLIRYTHMMEKVRAEHDTGHFSSEQLAKCFLFYLLSAVIFPNASGIGFL